MAVVSSRGALSWARSCSRGAMDGSIMPKSRVGGGVGWLCVVRLMRDFVDALVSRTDVKGLRNRIGSVLYWVRRGGKVVHGR